MAKKNFKPAIKAYILEVLTGEDHELAKPTDQQLWQYIADRFNSEYGYPQNIKRYGTQGAVREWLLGLAIGVDYTYCDIEKRLIEWGVLTGVESKAKRDKELDWYWDRLAGNILQEINKL